MKLNNFLCKLMKDLSPRHETGDVTIGLSVITYLGLITSLLCLTIFVFTYFTAKQVINVTLTSGADSGGERVGEL